VTQIWGPTFGTKIDYITHSLMSGAKVDDILLNDSHGLRARINDIKIAPNQPISSVPAVDPQRPVRRRDYDYTAVACGDFSSAVHP
jgi:hypothetical protein